jgi:hypothetical protein
MAEAYRGAAFESHSTRSDQKYTVAYVSVFDFLIKHVTKLKWKLNDLLISGSVRHNRRDRNSVEVSV